MSRSAKDKAVMHELTACLVSTYGWSENKTSPTTISRRGSTENWNTCWGFTCRLKHSIQNRTQEAGSFQSRDRLNKECRFISLGRSNAVNRRQPTAV